MFFCLVGGQNFVPPPSVSICDHNMYMKRWLNNGCLKEALGYVPTDGPYTSVIQLFACGLSTNFHLWN